MQNQAKHTDAHRADTDILRGPPGLLFGLTLLVFAAARLCFGWDTPPSAPSEPAAQVAAPSDDASPQWTYADVSDR